MNYSDKRDKRSSLKNQQRVDLKRPPKKNEKIKENKSAITNDRPKNSIMNLNLAINLSQQPIQAYQTNLDREEFDLQRITEARNIAQTKLRQAKLGTNVKLYESTNIEHEDCAKLMNFIIGGYVDNDFDEYLSLNEFNEKKENFNVLDKIYQNNLKKWKNHQRRKITDKEQVSGHQQKQRSLLAIMNLNQNSKHMTRAKFQELMKLNKMVQ